MSKKKVYFVRHGESVDNAKPVYQNSQSPLSETGRQQALDIADRVSRLPVEAIITSPLKRAEETAIIISERVGKPYEFSDLFIERVKPIELEGRSHTDVEATALWNKWEESLVTSRLRVPGGENFDDLQKRAERALDYLIQRKENYLLVVTHGYFLRMVAASVLFGADLTDSMFRSFHARMRTVNTGIFVFEHNGLIWRLEVWNDHSHLG